MKKKNYFNYIVILAVLIIPFMYSFFYLKAYWNPYGEGNIDNLPVAIINSDKGNKGTDLVNNILDSKKLKISVVEEKEATDGLNNGDYYAVISIPEDFTESLESAGEVNKSHATITYSPNQKSNYLASQIINNVVTVVEKNLDNTVNSNIVKELEDTVTSVPEQLEVIENGFETLSDGTKKLSAGSKQLSDGTTSLNENYAKFNDGLNTLNEGTNTLNNSVKEFNALQSGIDELTNGTTELKNGSDEFTVGLSEYTTGVNTVLEGTEALAQYVYQTVCPLATQSQNEQYIELCKAATGMLTPIEKYGNNTVLNYLTANSSALIAGNKNLNDGINKLATSVNSLGTVKTKIVDLQNGVETLATGANTLYTSSLQLKNGIATLKSGASTLNSGIYTLNESVISAKNELSEKLGDTKEEVKKVENLSTYSEQPVVVNTTPVNEVSSYGTAFSPFFISIALWVGCLMMFIVLYYDKEKRFGLLGIDSKDTVKRTLAYHGLATLSAILLGFLLQTFLDFEITNIGIYYLSIVIVANTFMAIMNFLIVNLNDVGKFIGLILLVLQLAAAGGTFPIETVTKGFRWLHPILPMTYSNRLLKESLMTFESNLFTKNVLVLLAIFIVFFVVNMILDIYKKQKNEK